MVELIIGTYGVLCWLVFKKWKLVPVTTYTVCTAILIGVAILGFLGLMLMMYHPVSKDGRLYMPTTPIVPQVRGMVVQSLEEGRDVSKGDILFKIDPTPYQYEVDRLEAQLAAANVDVAQLEERLGTAIAQKKGAESELLAAESDFDRQARERLAQAKAAVDEAKTQLEFSRKQLERNQELVDQKVISQLEFDRHKERFDTSQSQLKQAEAAEREAQQNVDAGGDRVGAVRQQVAGAEAQEREARLALEAQSGGVNPEVRRIMAELDSKRWELDQTVVRAPADGFVTQVVLRPGQMAVPMPLAPVMVFVHGEKPALAASYPQNVISHIEPGLEVELAFKSHPGKIFKGKVKHVLPATAEGQLTPSGQLVTIAPGKKATRIPVQIEYEDAVEDLNLPGGSQAMIAIYGHKMHALSLVRKILLRMKSWENYVFAP